MASVPLLLPVHGCIVHGRRPSVGGSAFPVATRYQLLSITRRKSSSRGASGPRQTPKLPPLAATMKDRTIEIKIAIARGTDKLDLSELDEPLAEIPEAVFDLTDLKVLGLVLRRCLPLAPDVSRPPPSPSSSHPHAQYLLLPLRRQFAFQPATVDTPASRNFAYRRGRLSIIALRSRFILCPCFISSSTQRAVCPASTTRAVDGLAADSRTDRVPNSSLVAAAWATRSKGRDRRYALHMALPMPFKSHPWLSIARRHGEAEQAQTGWVSVLWRYSVAEQRR